MTKKQELEMYKNQIDFLKRKIEDLENVRRNPRSIEAGYRPIGILDENNPPRGGSGVPAKKWDNKI